MLLMGPRSGWRGAQGAPCEHTCGRPSGNDEFYSDPWLMTSQLGFWSLVPKAVIVSEHSTQPCPWKRRRNPTHQYGQLGLKTPLDCLQGHVPCRSSKGEAHAGCPHKQGSWTSLLVEKLAAPARAAPICPLLGNGVCGPPWDSPQDSGAQGELPLWDAN